MQLDWFFVLRMLTEVNQFILLIVTLLRSME